MEGAKSKKQKSRVWDCLLLAADFLNQTSDSSSSSDESDSSSQNKRSRRKKLKKFINSFEGIRGFFFAYEELT